MFWLVEARDRAGNVTRTDAVSGDDEGAAGDTPYRVTIDQQPPELIGETAQTGIKYDGKEQRGDGSPVPGIPIRRSVRTVDVVGDELDPDSIDIGDFYVEGFSILSYIHPTDETGNELRR